MPRTLSRISPKGPIGSAERNATAPHATACPTRTCAVRSNRHVQSQKSAPTSGDLYLVRAPFGSRTGER
eukprot:1195824-Prorocentrum_minimum.AAC.1